MQIPGFRKGHAPLGLIKLRFSKYLENEAIQSLFEEKIQEAIEKYKPFIYGNPRIENLNIEDDKVSFTANLEVPPEIEIDFKEIKVEENPEDRIEKAVEKEIERLREINAEARSVKRKAKKGDIVFIDIKYGKKTIPSFSTNIGENEFFTKYLKGLKKDDEIEIEDIFPEDFPIEELRDKKEKVHMIVKDVKGLKLPKLSDEFAKEMGFDNLDKLKEAIKEQIKKENEEILSKKEDMIIEKIAEKLDIDPPETLVNTFLKEIKDEKKAKKMAKKTMILDAIALKYKLEVDDKTLAEEIDKIVAGRENISDEEINFIADLIKANLLRKKAIEFILEEVKK